MILVTGGAGFLGSVLVRKFVDNGETVRVLALPNEDVSTISDLNVEIVRGDIRNKGNLEQAMKGIESVYHCAGMIAITSKNPALLYDVNVNGTANVAQVALHEGIKSMVYVSSIHAFADIPRGLTIDETIPISPVSAIGMYGKTKAIATLKILEYVKKGLPCKIVCPTGIIGPFDYRPSRMGQLILEFMQNKTWYTLDGGYNFVDVRDVADGCILASTKGQNGEIYILSGEYLTFKRLFSILQAKLKVKKHLIYIPRWLLKLVATIEMRHAEGKEPLITYESLEIIASNSMISRKKAENELGFKSRPMDETITDTIEWFNVALKSNIKGA